MECRYHSGIYLLEELGRVVRNQREVLFAFTPIVFIDLLLKQLDVSTTSGLDACLELFWKTLFGILTDMLLVEIVGYKQRQELEMMFVSLHHQLFEARLHYVLEVGDLPHVPQQLKRVCKEVPVLFQLLLKRLAGLLPKDHECLVQAGNRYDRRLGKGLPGYGSYLLPFRVAGTKVDVLGQQYCPADVRRVLVLWVQLEYHARFPAVPQLTSLDIVHHAFGMGYLGAGQSLHDIVQNAHPSLVYAVLLQVEFAEGAIYIRFGEIPQRLYLYVAAQPIAERVDVASLPGLQATKSFQHRHNGIVAQPKWQCSELLEYLIAEGFYAGAGADESCNELAVSALRGQQVFDDISPQLQSVFYKFLHLFVSNARVFLLQHRYQIVEFNLIGGVLAPPLELGNQLEQQFDLPRPLLPTLLYLVDAVRQRLEGATPYSRELRFPLFQKLQALLERWCRFQSAEQGILRYWQLLGSFEKQAEAAPYPKQPGGKHRYIKQ